MKKEFNQLTTTAGEKVENAPWNVYPRPLLKRDSFYSLNGEWDFGVISDKCDYSRLDKETEIFNKKIIVPFSPESILSRVNEVFSEDLLRVYKKQFSLPSGFIKDRVILHFGAVDQRAEVFMNGKLVGRHAGGYSSFSFDVTEFLEKENHLIVLVKDDLSSKVYPYGKQSAKRGGMWYTPVSGIWQTVWLESVPKEYIKSVKAEYKDCYLNIECEGVSEATVTVKTPKGEISFELINGKAKVLLNALKFWSPENPYLYYFTVKSNGDKIESYFAIRQIEIKKVNGISRICLNGKPCFINALLDQGYWSDGLFTPASPTCYTEELTRIKALGFNAIRKHVKVEPELFYYDCDRLGVLVMQDFVNNGDYKFMRDTVIPTFIRKKKNDKKIHLDQKTREAFIDGAISTLKDVCLHPSVFYITIFNEGWGQFDGDRLYELVKEVEKTRIIDTTSGWFKGAKTDVESEHVYFKKIKAKKTEKPFIVSEFGGKVYVVDGHTFNPKNQYGYGKCKTREEFVNRIRKLYLEEVLPNVKKGLCGVVYTQVSDIEDETNGLFTYDRKVQKLYPDEFKDVASRIYKEIE